MKKEVDLQRLKKAINWLIFDEIVESRRDLAQKLGYTESGLSQMLTQKTAVSTPFIKKLLELYPSFDAAWLYGESDKMLKTEVSGSNNIVQNGNGNGNEQHVNIYDKNTEKLLSLLESKDKQIDRLISVIENQSKADR